VIYHSLQERKFIEELGAIEGPEMRFIFESSTVSIEIPAAVSGWRIIQPTPKLQVGRLATCIL
jgi:hypothetical protein